MKTSNLLEVENLSKSFPTAAGLLTILRGIHFTLNAGETCAVMGASGSGKTTLLGLCAGLDQPSAGRVRLNGIDLGERSEDERAQLRNEWTGFVFQTFRLIPSLTALENVMVPSELRGQKDARPRAMDLLERVGLAERIAHYPSQLSGGEQQRVAIARAFINQPRLIFADEPTGNLDEATSAHILDLLFELNATANTTLMLVTHDQDITRRVQRTITIKGGTIAADTAHP